MKKFLKNFLKNFLKHYDESVAACISLGFDPAFVPQYI